MNDCEDKIVDRSLARRRVERAESEALRVHVASCAECGETRRRLEKMHRR